MAVPEVLGKKEKRKFIGEDRFEVTMDIHVEMGTTQLNGISFFNIQHLEQPHVLRMCIIQFGQIMLLYILAGIFLDINKNLF